MSRRPRKKIDYPLYSPESTPVSKKPKGSTKKSSSKKASNNEEMLKLRQELDKLLSERESLEKAYEDMQEKLSEIESDYQSSEDKLKQFELNLKEVLKENKVLKEKLEISYQEKHDMESNLNEALREQRLLKKKNVELNTEVESLKQFTKDLESSLSSRQLEQEEIDDLKQKRKLLDKIPSSIGPFSSFLDIQQIEGEKKWECTCKCPSNDKELEFFLEIMDDGLVEYVPLGGSMKSKTFDLSDLPEYLGKIIHFNESHIPQFIAKMISYLHNTKM